MKQYKIVSGINRSGTSMMMQMIKAAGVPIIGDKYAKKTDKNLRDKHPGGFWEVGKVTMEKGLVYKARHAGKGGEAIKVMMEVVAMSYPDLIEKAVLIFREPRCVLTSITDYNVIPDVNEFIMHLCFNIVDTVGFITAFKKPRKIFIYDEILKNPKKNCKELCDFIGGDYHDAQMAINRKLKRSKKYDIKGDAIDMWDRIYKLAKRRDTDGIIALEKELIELGNKITK